jgi:hypothetical protein
MNDASLKKIFPKWSRLNFHKFKYEKIFFFIILAHFKGKYKILFYN